MSRQVQCLDFQSRWETREAAQSAIDHIRSRDGKEKGKPRYVVECGAHFHISSKEREPIA